MTPTHKHSAVSQDVEQFVTADLMATVRQNDPQLSNSQSGHVPPDHFDFIDDGCVVHLLDIVGLTLIP